MKRVQALGRQVVNSSGGSRSSSSDTALPPWATGLTPNLSRLLTAPDAMAKKGLPDITLAEARAGRSKADVVRMWGEYPHTAKRDVLIRGFEGADVGVRVYHPAAERELEVLAQVRRLPPPPAC